ncbi:DUF3603 family protein [Amphibacillus jilinensis]|uniref:DUF3603 family protein n=1 Tax=Amphibacillus jilinensis TaxID=1216008 RepID=UPI000315C27E|nr:DUF3603 family protein [Amphibacillus jilinensis]
MMVMHDVWVNWFEGEENGYNVCPFYEWRKLDDIELVDVIPVLYIETRLFNYIENDLDDLPKKMLDLIQNQTIVKGDSIRHAAIVTDGSGIIAFDTMGYQIPLKKSRLIPRQERKVLQLVQQRSRQYFSLKRDWPEKEYHLFSLPPKAMIGLVRRERELKHLTMLALDGLKQGHNLDEVHYWLTEWEPDCYTEVKKLCFEDTWHRLYLHVHDGWSVKHENFCRAIIKGNPLFEQLWNQANGGIESTVLKRIK